ncbi:gamma-glutamyl hydrolase isoform X2 [Halyomorpha halys]|uniref:gamma-glutamyl hydrolase isoform X2 n=1 Tax=Halyomorpha halys TaxID=286706 RepID=UPI0006D4F0E6|nr:gamma-glutamyl hydrolase-like isoform X2 [Halyomorpha halys]
MHGLRNKHFWKSLVLFITLIEIGKATDRPIIGLLAQETSEPMKKLFPEHTSYISASYVKALESSGSRVVPIFLNKTEEYYRHLLRSLNGLLLPGGNTWFYRSHGYADAGSILYDEAKKINDEGVHFPILGICLGFELLLFLDNGKKEYRTNCELNNVPLPLEFVAGYESSILFRNASESIINILKVEPVTVNQHRFCVTEKNMTEFHLNKNWKVLSTNQDVKNNLTFISSLESTKYPFVGLQFHPEKNNFEWRKDLNYPHSANAIATSRYFFDWLVSYTRLNNNSFENEKKVYKNLISNFQVTLTAGKLIYDEVYFF